MPESTEAPKKKSKDIILLIVGCAAVLMIVVGACLLWLLGSTPTYTDSELVTLRESSAALKADYTTVVIVTKDVAEGDTISSDSIEEFRKPNDEKADDLYALKLSDVEGKTAKCDLRRGQQISRHEIGDPDDKQSNNQK